VTEGQSASFSAVAAGSAPLAYQWLRNGVAISGATAGSYSLGAAVLGDSGATFSVRVTNSAGQVTSVAVALQVNAAPVAPSITSQPAAARALAGQTAGFSVVAVGTAPLSYQWRRNGVDLPGANQPSYTTPALVLTDSGAQFTVLVSNSLGNVASSAATLTVDAAASATRPAVLSCSDQGAHTLALQRDGTVWAWGRNENGQLGDGTLGSRTQAAPVPGLTGVTAVAAGVKHSLFLRNDGSVLGVGSDAGGELGAGSAAPLGYRGAVTLSTVVSGATFIAAGKGLSSLDPGASVAVTASGVVRGWGRTPDLTTVGNFGGAAGLTFGGFPLASAVDADSRGSLLVVGRDGSLWYLGTNLQTLGASVFNPVYQPTQMPGLDNVQEVAMGSFHVVALKRDGTVWTWGSGQLGYAVPSGQAVNTPTQVPGLTDIVRVAASQTMSMALRNDGTVLVWGTNAEGQLGLGSAVGGVVVTPTAVPGLGRVRDVCAGWLHSVFALEDGSVWASGDNRWGQLGAVTPSSINYTPVRVTGLSLPR
jgi:alpha-tubulin suppressor-like RCC1 family protein